jgi:hypothetical protein
MLFAFADDPPTSEATSPVHLLVVDDDSAVVAMTRLVLRDRVLAGRPVVTHTATSAAEARSFLEATDDPIAVAIIDVVMESEDAGLKPGPVRRRPGLPASLAPGGPAPPAKATSPTTGRGAASHQGPARPVAPHPLEHTAVADL